MSTFARRILARKPVAPVATVPSVQGCRIEDAAGLITDPATGKYPHRSAMRDELERSLRLAERVWGADTLWADIDELSFTKLLRVRVEELVAKNCRAVRAAEITVGRIITTVGWLREVRRIARDAAPWPKSWKAQITQHWQGVTKSIRAPEPHRPRYTLDEAQRILRASNFDPRLEMLLWLGCELRLGQVARALRSDLDLPLVDWQAPETNETDYGTLQVYGAGKKSGTTVDITRGQRRRVDDALSAGYLAPAEEKYQAKALADYCLFPAGYVVGRVGFTRGETLPMRMSDKIDWQKHCTSSWVRKNFREAEKRAGVEHVEGRGAYGIRRQGRDVADTVNLSPSAIENFGGWTPGSPIPAKVYRERGNRVGRREARGARAALRGEENVA